MDTLAIRAYTQKTEEQSKEKESVKRTFEQPPTTFDRVLVFDTETSADEFLNLKFGYFEVLSCDVREYGGLIYDERHLTIEEIAILQRYAKKHKLRLFPLHEFITIFYWEVYEKGTLCIGYNLNFDLSRIILDDGYGRNAGRGGFSFTLTPDLSYPRVRIKQLHGRCYNIHFPKAKQKYANQDTFQGYFLDVQQLACILADEKSLSLEKACEIFGIDGEKQKVKQHGIITPKYIRYNINDVKITYQVFQKVRKELLTYQLDLPITRIYSAASLGKQALRQCNIQPFLKTNPQFPKEIIGQCMSAYYGGRCETRIRKTPTKTTVLDVNSTYPTITLLLDLWKFVIAEQITYYDDTKNVQEFIDHFTYAQALDQKLWPSFNVLVTLEPDEDLLPARTQYDEEEDTYNIGLNYLTYKEPLHYFLPDVLASKLLTGKTPRIKQALRFVPEGVQETLHNTAVCGVPINPKKDNLIQQIAEKRRAIKARIKRLKKDDLEYTFLNAQQKALKILNLATTYGIYIELHPKEGKHNLTAYSNKIFPTNGIYEEPGTYFNPIVGASITAAARLLLAIAEKFVTDNNEIHAYMDTDSIFVPPHLAQALSDQFIALNPYGEQKTILEIEEGMENLLFYGISSKRYCLHKKAGKEITIPIGKKPYYKLHGLGYITNPFKTELKENDDWHKQLWMDILTHHYDVEQRERILQKYDEKAVITKMSVTTKDLLTRFKNINNDKNGKELSLDKRIKPFNFFLIGYATVTIKRGRTIIPVKPMTPFRNNPQEAINESFINYYTGEVMQGAQYWKRLSEVFQEYINHNEAKFTEETATGILNRRHLTPKGITYIGKEANKVETYMLDGWPVNQYQDDTMLREYILQLTPKNALKIGIKYRSTLRKIKERARSKEPLNYNTSEMKKILQHYNTKEPFSQVAVED